MSESQQVPGSTGRPPTEGKWVAEPRDPDPKAEGDGVKRLTEDDRLETANPVNLQPGPDEEDVDEKVVESGVEKSKIDAETEVALNPKAI